jgi:flagellar protein FliO/FliZ
MSAVAFISASSAALAQIATPVVPDDNVASELLRVVLSLVAIVVLIVAAGWMTRKLQGRQMIGGRRLRCLESMSVGARDRVLLLDADGKRLLIGVGAGGVRTLHVYDGEAPVTVAEPVAAPNFSELLGKWRLRR